MEKYNTFWKRFLAAIIDGLIFIPISSIEYSIPQNNKFLLIGWLLLLLLLMTAYSVLCHGLFGQTIGKKIMNIKVYGLDEVNKIGLKYAFYREAIWVFANLSGIAYLLFNNQTNSIERLQQQHDDILFITTIGWLVIELITMLANPKRRALHDLLAKSVVINLAKQ